MPKSQCPPTDHRTLTSTNPPSGGSFAFTRVVRTAIRVALVTAAAMLVLAALVAVPLLWTSYGG